jgi:uncharacterized protein YbjT (DUF2867 family)
MMLLVFGAAGTCGAAVVRALARRGAKVRGFVRNETRVAAAHAAGAFEVVVGDLRNLASVEDALKGVSGVYYVAPRFIADEASIGRMVVRAANRADIRGFVYQSVMHSNVRAILHHEAKSEVEEALYASNLEFTILQAARMMHNITPVWRRIATSGMYVEPFSPDVPIADVDYDDVAEVAASALTTAGYGKATLELCADGMLNRHQRAVLLSEAMGRPIRAGSCSVEDWLAKAGIVDPYEAEARTRMFRYYDDFGFQGGNALVLRSLLGKEPTSYQSFLKRTAEHLNALIA